jgi:hypothetical protein
MRKQFSVIGDSVTILGLSGRRDSKDWAIDVFEVMVEQCDEFPAGVTIAKIEKLILADIKAGNESKIDHVLISNRYAVLLFLDGKINREMLETGQVVNGDLVIQMFIEGAMRKVIIRDEKADNLEYHCATIDSEGKSV